MRGSGLKRLEKRQGAAAEREQVLAQAQYHALTHRARIEIYKTDSAQASKVRDYTARLERLKKSKPAPPRPVKGGT